MGDEPKDVFLRLVQPSDVADGRNDLSPESLAAERMVLGDVADVHAEDRPECEGIGARTGLGVLPDGLADVAEVAAGHGADRT